MPRYVALLRGINIGGHIVKMDRLRALFGEIGYPKAETFIASGNVVFDSTAKSVPALEEKIAAHLERSLSFPVATFIRTVGELSALLGHEAVESAGSRKVYVGFLAEPPSKAARTRLLSHASNVDTFHLTRREVFWVCNKPMMSESPFFRVGIEKGLGMEATVRGAPTIANIVEKYS
jgi:uncharacterized protein (DUF1697 family)